MCRDRLIFGIMLSAVLLPAAMACADKVTLNDGTVLEGRAIRQSDGYWIKLADGSTRQIPNDEIKTVEKAEAPAPTPTPADASSSTAASAGTTAHTKTLTLASARHRADAAPAPLAAVAIWQEFIDSHPSDPDLKTANDQLALWKQRNDEGMAKVNGKWLSGKEVKELAAQITAVRREVFELITHNEMLKAVKKLEEADKLYPDSYQISFSLGYLSLLEKQYDKALQCFAQTLKSKPGFAPAIANTGVVMVIKNHVAEGLVKLQQAAEIEDSPEIAHDLILVVNHLTPAQRGSERAQSAIAAANLLANKYPDNAATRNTLLWVPFREPVVAAPEARMWSGTGFIISSDGLILTNRHVAKDAKSLMVTLGNGTETTGTVQVIDDEQDLALIRIRIDPAAPLKYVNLSSIDTPPAGADCTVMGYPLLDRLGANIKVTRGIVTGLQQTDLDADILIDAKVNPGNSGGPILNKHGNVMAIVSMKTLSSQREDTYGIGISAGHIRKFLLKNKILLKMGDESGAPLSPEEIAARVQPSTVMIFATQ